jgi:hypothetical protein
MMSQVSVLFACLAMAATAMPAPGASVGIGCGVFAMILGFVGFRSKHRPGRYRLIGASGLGIAGIAITLCSARVMLALLAIDRIAAIAG